MLRRAQRTDRQMMTSPQVRRAHTSDADAISRVLCESFAEFKPLYTKGGFAATALGAEQILIRMQQGPAWVALRDGSVLGTVAAVAKVQSVYVRGMAVVPAARGTGAGSALLREVEDWAVSGGFVRLFLSTTPFLSSAIRLYERFGFQRMDEDPQDLFGTPLFTMERTVGR